MSDSPAGTPPADTLGSLFQFDVLNVMPRREPWEEHRIRQLVAAGAPWWSASIDAAEERRQLEMLPRRVERPLWHFTVKPDPNYISLFGPRP